MIKILKKYLRKYSWIRKIYRIIKGSVDAGSNVDSFHPTVEEAYQYTPRRCNQLGHEMRLNLLVPTIDKEYVFGGISTALTFYNEMLKEMNVKKRIIICDIFKDNSDANTFKDYKVHKNNDDSADDFQIVPYCNRLNESFPVGENDIFIATGWWTAYSIIPIIKWQAETYNKPKNPLIYLIQDYEPGFYQWSSRHVMAESTYKSDIPVIAVFNTTLLKDYFLQKNYKFFREYSFEPCLNKVLKSFLIPNGKIRKKQILIYGRPFTPRNAFELIIDALRIWAQKQKDSREWSIISAGEDFPNVFIQDGQNLKSLGKLTLEEYATKMLESYAGISLMISPHPSYPPLEMSTFGMKVITNSYENKDLSGFNQNIISLNSLTPDSVAEELLKLTRAYAENESEFGYNEQYMTNSNSFDLIIKQIETDLIQLN